MSETTDKPKLGMRAPLGVKRTVETGQVKQSFSHGRSNTVVVEVKKRRILGPAGAPVAEVAAPVVEAAPPPPPPAAPVARATPAAPPQRPSSANDMLSRRELQERLLLEAEDARMNANALQIAADRQAVGDADMTRFMAAPAPAITGNPRY